jgi:exopolysaccharide production protein ExoQ
LCSIALIGWTGVLLFIVAGSALAADTWRKAPRELGRFSFLFALPFLAIISTGWSDAPQLTMRTALQLTLTIGLSILIAANLSPRRLIVALFIGALALCASAVPNLPSAIDSGLALTSSYLGSKNQLGFAAFLLFATSLAIVLDPGQAAWPRLIALLFIPMSIAFVYLSRSGGATVSILISALLFPLFAVLTLFKPRGRLIISALGIIAFGAALLFHQEVQNSISNFRSEVLEKNETLNGRTTLWAIAHHLWAEKPLLGHGYAAFWRHGNLEAEALWRTFGITARRGFNFHNVFVETRVDLGLVGLAILVLTLAIAAILMISRQLRAPSIPGAFLLSAFCVLIVRSTIEIGLFSEFNMLTLIWVAGAVYATRDERAARPPIRRPVTASIGKR